MPPGRPLSPTWIHVSVRRGPRPRPPTPTHAAMWPPGTLGGPRAVIVATTPDAARPPALPAYAYGRAQPVSTTRAPAGAGAATATTHAAVPVAIRYVTRRTIWRR